MRVIYSIGIGFYTLGVRIAALFGHANARLMVKGWKSASGKLDRKGAEVAWFHSASLGEFEQARPVLEEYKRRHPEARIVVTFFSPSGYEVRKNYPLADRVMYLPMDTPRNARRLVREMQPTVAFFVKYEFWYNYLEELHRHNIPTYIFSAIFRPEQYFFRWYGGWFRKQLGRCFTHIFVQNEESLQLLQANGIEQCTIAGDTRFDRVHEIAEAAERNEVAEKFLNGHFGKTIVCGSTWPPDEELLHQVVNSELSNLNVKIILAPHVIAEEHLRQVEQLFPDSIRYSELNTKHLTLNTKSVLIIDNIGLLSKLYRYADIAYIGGGFGVGIHNILEAVTFGKPVLFGPNYHKFKEANDMITRGGAFSHRNATELVQNIMPLLTDNDTYNKATEACKTYMQENLGSTNKILGLKG